MHRTLSILCLALAFMVAAPASAGCGKLGKLNPFKRHKAACGSQAPLESVAASVVAAPAAPAAAVTVLTYGAPFGCQNGQCGARVKVRIK